MILLLFQRKHLLDVVPEDLLMVLQCAVLLVPLLFPALWYFIGVLLAVGHICFLCSGHVSIASLVPLIFWRIFPLSLLMVLVAWVGLVGFCSLYLDSSYGSTLGGGAV